MIRIPPPEFRLSAAAARHLAGDLATSKTHDGSRTLFDRYLDFLTSENFDSRQRAVALSRAEPLGIEEERDVRLHAMIAAIIITVAITLGFCFGGRGNEGSPRVVRISESMERPADPGHSSPVSAARIDIVT